MGSDATLGDSFAFQAPVSSIFTYTWLANIKSSTPVIFTMVNTLEKQGGSSNAQVVGYSNNSTCLPSGHNGLLNGAITRIIITLIILIFGIISSFSSYEAGESPTTRLTSITTNNLFLSHGLPAEYQMIPFILPSKPESLPVMTSKHYSNSTSTISATSLSPLPSPNPTC